MIDRFPQPPAGHRDWYAFEAIRALPRILQLVDKNPLSETFGCFDREFWHYRTVDFPCGMSQEMCLPLALAHAHPFPHNPYYGNERLRQIAIGGIEFAQKASHPDGSTDDYFPFERALGALVFSTYAMTETYRVLELQRPDLVEFFRLRGEWLRNHNETGQLANHQAFAALALYNVYLITGEERFRDASNHFRDITLSWQQPDGWFQEYEGADPGYQSCTVAFLAKLFQKSHDQSLLEPMERAIEFCSHFMHPDGSYAGEYGSRNTYHFYPHGFEVFSRHFPTAGRIAETYLHRSMPERRRYYNDDNRMCAHYVYDWMQAWLDYNPDRAGTLEEQRAPFEKHFAAPGLFVKKTPRYYAVVALNKGGVVKVFGESGPLLSDTGIMLQTDDGRVLVPHLVSDYGPEVDPEGGRIRLRGKLAWRRHQLPSPPKQMAFRAMNLTVGRLSANLVRSTLQKVLITGKPWSDVEFERTITFTDDDVRIEDRLDAGKSTLRFARMMVGSDATSIYVANSNVFQESVLLPWVDLSSHVGRLNEERSIALPPRGLGEATEHAQAELRSSA